MSACQRVGLAVHELLGLGEVGALAALDEVAREGERRAGEADERHLQLALEELDGLEHVAEALLRLDDAELVDLRARVAMGSWMTGPSPLANSNGAPIGSSGQEDVGEEDRRVDAEHERLERDLSGELGRLAELEQRVLLAQRAVLGHVAAGLAHEPDGRRVDGLAAAGAEEAIVHGRRQ